MQLADTVAAIATAPGEAGLAVVRCSGPAAAALLGRVFRPTRSGPLIPRRLTHGWVVDPVSGEPIDESLAVLLPGPRTYTGEDQAELQCHGGRLSPKRVLEALLAAGARLAEPGELSLRAFLHGRIDLAQAEATLDLIRARTERAHRLAAQGLAGRLSDAIRGLRAELLAPLAQLQAGIDFTEDEIPAFDPRPGLRSGLARIAALLVGSEQGLVYRQGVRVAIVGRPNVGKSSLLNALLGSDRAIVAAEPGTTRDTVEECANLGGVPFWLVDTAGLRESADPVEQIGVARGREALAQADLVLAVFDGSRPIEPEDRALLAELAGRPAIIALNKSDLGTPVGQPELETEAGRPILTVSALTGAGLPQLVSGLVELALGGQPAADPRVTNRRHRDALRRSQEALGLALEAREAGLPDDIVAGELSTAIDALGEITGERATEDLLESIFSRFCIGK